MTGSPLTETWRENIHSNFREWLVSKSSQSIKTKGIQSRWIFIWRSTLTETCHIATHHQLINSVSAWLNYSILIAAASDFMLSRWSYLHKQLQQCGTTKRWTNCSSVTQIILTFQPELLLWSPQMWRRSARAWGLKRSQFIIWSGFTSPPCSYN